REGGPDEGGAGDHALAALLRAARDRPAADRVRPADLDVHPRSARDVQRVRLLATGPRRTRRGPVLMLAVSPAAAACGSGLRQRLAAATCGPLTCRRQR